MHVRNVNNNINIIKFVIILMSFNELDKKYFDSISLIVLCLVYLYHRKTTYKYNYLITHAKISIDYIEIK